MAFSNEQSTSNDKVEVFEFDQPASYEVEQGNGAVLLDIGHAGKSELGSTNLKLTDDGNVSTSLSRLSNPHVSYELTSCRLSLFHNRPTILMTLSTGQTSRSISFSLQSP